MRVLNEFTMEGCRVTLFQWNNRYLIKIEAGPMEQTFKVDQFEFAGDDELISLLDETFMKEALARFSDMASSMQSARERLQNHTL